MLIHWDDKNRYMDRYKKLFEHMLMIHSKIEAADIKGLYEYDDPNEPATEEQLLNWEQDNNLNIPSSYRAFLLNANGWKNIVQAFELFSIDALSFDKSNQYNEFLSFCIDNLSDYGDKLCLLPIGANHESYDLYLMVLDSNSEYYGQVIWVAGEEVERYDDFEKFFNSLIKGNEYVYKLLIGEAEKP